MPIWHKMVKIGKGVNIGMTKELWKDIPGFNGVYQVSTLGRVRSVDRNVDVITPTRKKGHVRRSKGVILSLEKSPNGFNYARIYQDGVKVKRQLHRLVAVTFLENPNGCKYVRFKDGDKDNLEVKNLEWTNEKTRIMRNVNYCSAR